MNKIIKTILSAAAILSAISVNEGWSMEDENQIRGNVNVPRNIR